jgi:hypothetical protein
VAILTRRYSRAGKLWGLYAFQRLGAVRDTRYWNTKDPQAQPTIPVPFVRHDAFTARKSRGQHPPSRVLARTHPTNHRCPPRGLWYIIGVLLRDNCSCQASCHSCLCHPVPISHDRTSGRMTVLMPTSSNSVPAGCSSYLTQTLGTTCVPISCCRTMTLRTTLGLCWSSRR